MKTEASTLQHYFSLKIADGNTIEEKAHLKVISKDPFRNNHHFYVLDGIATEPENWDEKWFGNYE